MTARTKFPVSILFRPLLIQGALAFKDETIMFTSSLVILVNSKQSVEEQTVTLFHEALHILLRAGGIEAPHDEEWIEERAQALARACPDLIPKIVGAKLAHQLAKEFVSVQPMPPDLLK